jgi:hypothetical protein
VSRHRRLFAISVSHLERAKWGTVRLVFVGPRLQIFVLLTKSTMRWQMVVLEGTHLWGESKGVANVSESDS